MDNLYRLDFLRYGIIYGTDFGFFQKNLTPAQRLSPILLKQWFLALMARVLLRQSNNAKPFMSASLPPNPACCKERFDMNEMVRPTKKQRQLLDYIERFIGEHGYSPSYREIMNGCGYNSVATVALHINSLVARGHLIKRQHSARSLEVVKKNDQQHIKTNLIKASEEKWLVSRVDLQFSQAEQGRLDQKQIDELYVLVGALRVLGLEGAAGSFISRLSRLKKQI